MILFALFFFVYISLLYRSSIYFVIIKLSMYKENYEATTLSIVDHEDELRDMRLEIIRL